MNNLKTYQYTKLLYIFTLFIFTSSCASFSKDRIVDFHLTESNFAEFNGVFSNEVLLNIFDEDQDIDKESFLKEIDRKLIKDTLVFDKEWDYKFKLQVINSRQTEIQYIENDKIIRRRIIKSEIGKDGFLYLKNKNTKFIMLPHVFGAIDVKKVRLSINGGKDLVLEVVQHRSGAMLLIVFRSYNNFHSIKTYKRLE